MHTDKLSPELEPERYAAPLFGLRAGNRVPSRKRRGGRGPRLNRGLGVFGGLERIAEGAAGVAAVHSIRD